LRPRAGAVIADRVIETILTAIERLDRSPARGRPGRRTGTRASVITRYSYIVIYEVDWQDIDVARIPHTAQRGPPAEDQAVPA
jgi:plasmid stabilization system protein ParE